jgi:predicted amidohydrolase YtcJ
LIIVSGSSIINNELNKVLINGKIITVDDKFSIKQAVGIKGDRISCAGTNDQIKPFISRNTEVIDLKGKTVLPGINDSHTHTALWGGSRPPLAVDVTYPAVKSIKDIVKAVGKKVKTAKPGEWIRGLGWNEGFLDECLKDKNRHPTKDDLDPVSPHNPVCLVDFSVHTIWVNSKALQLAGVNKETPIPTGGDIVRDPATGELTGLLREFAAQGLIMRVVPLWTKAEKRIAIVNAIKELNSMGITSLTEAALGSGGNTYQGGFLGSECISIYNDLMNENQLNARVNILYLFGEYGANSLKDFEDIVPQLGIHSGFGNEKLKIGGIKIFADGIPPTRTAWVSQEYLGGGKGSLVLPGATDEERTHELESMIRYAHKLGFQVGVHAIGDLAIGATIDSFVKAEKEAPRGLRHYVMHVDFMTPRQAKTAAKYDIGVNAQPSLLWTISDLLVDVVGLKRVKKEWPYRMILDAGCHLSGSSDAPCTYPSWLQAIQSAVLRESKATGKVYSPDQCLSREEAIRMYTMGGAWQDHQEDIKGSIEVGKLADLCVLDENILKVDAHKIKDIRNLMTIMDGKIVFNDGV